MVWIWQIFFITLWGLHVWHYLDPPQTFDALSGIFWPAKQGFNASHKCTEFAQCANIHQRICIAAA